ncbi:hypothetical protein BPOR_0087g00090 [Botrytis porri]|uniref:Uncharacterized protein n=1 Tax=Botrytis porri TaxID=87229 RepID=A0A4Z1KZF6_9HELO|nr:hypothetical protein BPOR_0087g00090 [Botrytis porri]
MIIFYISVRPWEGIESIDKKCTIKDNINQLLPTDLTLLHRLHSAQNTLEALAKLVQGHLVNLDFSIGQEAPGHLPKALCEFKVLGLGGDFGGAEGESLAETGVAEGGFIFDLGVVLVYFFGGDGEESAVDAAGGRHG